MPDIDTLLWHMSEWETHSLRGLVTVMVITAQLYARDHPDDAGAAALAEKLVVLKRDQFETQHAELRAEVVRRAKPDA